MNEVVEAKIPEVIAKELEAVERMRQRIFKMIPVVGIAQELIDTFKDTVGTSDWRLSVGYETGTLNGVLVHVDSLDFRELVPVRRWIRNRGFKAPTTSNYEAIKRRSWTYKRDVPEKGEPNLVFSAFIPWNSDAKTRKCDFVQIGVKEEPIYELRCNGDKVEESEDGKSSKN